MGKNLFRCTSPRKWNNNHIKVCQTHASSSPQFSILYNDHLHSTAGERRPGPDAAGLHRARGLQPHPHQPPHHHRYFGRPSAQCSPSGFTQPPHVSECAALNGAGDDEDAPPPPPPPPAPTATEETAAAAAAAGETVNLSAAAVAENAIGAAAAASDSINKVYTTLESVQQVTLLRHFQLPR